MSSFYLRESNKLHETQASRLLMIWNDFYNPLLYIRSEELKTISLGLSKYMGRYLTNYLIMFAAVVLASLPVIAVFVALQKQFHIQNVHESEGNYQSMSN